MMIVLVCIALLAFTLAAFYVWGICRAASSVTIDDGQAFGGDGIE